MNSKQVEVLQKFFSVLVKPPVVKLEENVNLDEPVILIDNGAFSIRDTVIERKTIGRTIEAPGFALDAATYRAATRWEPEEHDYAELYSDQNYVNVAKEAVKHYLHCQIDNQLNDAYAQEFASEEETWA